MNMAMTNLHKAHKHCSMNKKALANSQVAGCFYCCKIFSPKLIKEWIDSGKTAICPLCGIDSVLPESNDYTIEPEFLKEMASEWFT